MTVRTSTLIYDSDTHIIAKMRSYSLLTKIFRNKPHTSWINTMTKIFLILVMVDLWSGCGGDSDSPAGPQGQALEVDTDKWDNGNIKVEFQYYRDGGKVVNHGFYREYDRGGNLIIEGDYSKGERWSGEFFLNVEWNGSASGQFGLEGYYTISPSSDATARPGGRSAAGRARNP